MIFSTVATLFLAASASAMPTSPSTEHVALTYTLSKGTSPSTTTYTLLQPAPVVSDPYELCLTAFRADVYSPFNIVSGSIGSDLVGTVGTSAQMITFAATVTKEDHVVQSCKVLAIN